MPIKVTVVDGKCMEGVHHIEDSWEIGYKTPEGMCLGAWGSIFPFVFALNMGAKFSWVEVPTEIKIHCPDPKGITLEIKKMETS